jgi:membrane associated rhomboid family serine protease
MRRQEAKAIAKRDTGGSIARELKTQVVVLGGFIALIWGLEIVDSLFLGGALNIYGIRPRSITGLFGILFAPFLHGSLGHVAANTIPFLTLGWLIMLRETSDFFVVTIITMLVSGLGVWLTAPAYSIHIGASGVIFGYFGFLLLRGYFERSFAAILFSLIVGLLYGGLIWGVLPLQYGISWQGHLFGFIGGALAARLLAQSKRSRVR